MTIFEKRIINSVAVKIFKWSTCIIGSSANSNMSIVMIMVNDVNVWTDQDTCTGFYAREGIKEEFHEYV